MVMHQLYLKKKGTKRWLKAGYPRDHTMIKKERKLYLTNKKYDVKMKRAYK